jgi:hypothetical protein
MSAFAAVDRGGATEDRELSSPGELNFTLKANARVI